MATRRERIEGGLVGMLVGDALGVPYEFHEAAEIPEPSLIELEPPEGFRRAHGGVAPGTWSDDGAQALCLLASLLHAGRLDLDDFARRLRNWYELGYCAVDSEVFDVGVQTGRAIRALQAGAAAARRARAASATTATAASCACCRWRCGTAATTASSCATRCSRRCRRTATRARSCGARSTVCGRVACSTATADGEAAWLDAVATLQALVSGDDRDELSHHVVRARAASGSGYVVDTLHSARAALGAGGYEATVRAAIWLGDDTDTTACVAGGLAGVRDGVAAIPARWQGELRGREILDPLLAALLAR